MNEIIKVKAPDNSKVEGMFYIQPLETFSAKGVNWTRVLEFKAVTSAVVAGGKRYVVRYWAEPKYNVTNCGNVGAYALDGSGWKDCECEECLAGRKEVLAGWFPE